MDKMNEVSLTPPEKPEALKKVRHKTLRHASLDDIPYLISLARRLVKDSPIEKIGVSERKARESLEHFIANAGKDYLCLISYDEDKVVGVLAAYAFSPIFSEERVACEVLWYLEPEYRKGRRGVDMMKAYEYWAEMTGCKVVQYGWMTSSPLSMKKLYDLSGAVLSEETYYKEL